jgi:regulator of RNase E activity RraA
MTTTTDSALHTLRTRLNTNVVGDILDLHGFYHQFLPAPIRSIGGPAVLAGRAMPVLMIDVFEPQKKPFGLLTEALDQLQPDEIYLASGGMHRCAYWGEILTATARYRGAVGAVIDGYHRDTTGILAQDWPVFSRGSFAQDSSVRTRVADFRCRIEIAGVVVQPGDIVFGDIDGVVVIPQAMENDIIAGALEKASGEKTVLKDIQAGLSSTEAFAKHGIL